MAEEVWKQHHIYDLYEGSSMGRIRHITSGRILKPSATIAGYLSVVVRGRRMEKSKTIMVHRFIYSCFNEDFVLLRSNEVDHINSQVADNSLTNLRPTDRTTNNRYAQANRDMKKITCGVQVPIVATNLSTNERKMFRSKYQCGQYFNKSPAMIYFALHNMNHVKHIVTDEGKWKIEELTGEGDHE
jgi:hypothetical protein